MLRARKVDVATRFFDMASFDKLRFILSIRVLDDGFNLSPKDLYRYQTMLQSIYRGSGLYVTILHRDVPRANR